MGESVELTLILFVELEKNFIGKFFYWDHLCLEKNFDWENYILGTT